MTNLLPKDVAQEAHFSNRDTWDSCQDGKQIRDVSKQSAKAPQSRGFLFSAQRIRTRVNTLFQHCLPRSNLLGAAAPECARHSRVVDIWLH